MKCFNMRGFNKCIYIKLVNIRQWKFKECWLSSCKSFRQFLSICLLKCKYISGCNSQAFVYCLVVFNFSISADDLSSDFGLQGIPVQSLHGNREQCDREQALEDFKKGEFAFGVVICNHI